MRHEIFDFEEIEAMKRGWCFLAVEPVIKGLTSAFSSLSPSAPAALPPPPPPPSRSDPAVQASISGAKKKQRDEDLRRRGRKSTILTGGAGVVGEAPLSQPRATGAILLGG